jgi:hypothetical protein
MGLAVISMDDSLFAIGSYERRRYPTDVEEGYFSKHSPGFFSVRLFIIPTVTNIHKTNEQIRGIGSMTQG